MWRPWLTTILAIVFIVSSVAAFGPGGFLPRISLGVSGRDLSLAAGSETGGLGSCRAVGRGPGPHCASAARRRRGARFKPPPQLREQP